MFCFVKLLSGQQVCVLFRQTAVGSPGLSYRWSDCCQVTGSVFCVVKLLSDHEFCLLGRQTASYQVTSPSSCAVRSLEVGRPDGGGSPALAPVLSDLWMWVALMGVGHHS